jgi:excisionase family DNA binding protein
MATLDIALLEPLVQEIVERVVTERIAALQQSPWMSTAEAADYLRCPVGYVYEGRTNGRFTPHKRGGAALLDRKEIEAHASGVDFPARDRR